MKHLYKFCLYAASLLTVTSCVDDSALEFNVEKPESVAVQEAINAYDALKTYVDRSANPNFKLGAGASISEYNSQGLMYRLLNANFDELTAGYGMKHGAVVQTDGSLKLDNVKKFLETTSEAGLSVYGHTLCWHANQNAEFLNSTIAPIIIPGTGVHTLDPSVIANTDFESGATGWSGWGNGSTRGLTAAGGGYGGTGYAYYFTNPTVTNFWSAQIAYDLSPLELGASYVLNFKVKASASGSIRAEVQSTADYSSDGFGTFALTTDWQEYTQEVVAGKDNRNRFVISFGDYGGTVYIDNVTLRKRNPESGGGTPGEIWIEAESASTVGSKWQKQSDELTSGGEYMLVPNTEPNGSAGTNLTNTATITDADVIKLNVKVDDAGQYKLWLRVAPQNPSMIGNDDSFHLKMDDGGWYTFNNAMGANTNWIWYSISDYTLGTGSHTLTISYREDGAKLDKIYLTKNGDTPSEMGGSSGGGDQIIEKTQEEKADTLTTELERWIAGMMDLAKPYVKAWDVVNEPMSDGSPYELKTGVGKTLATDEFYWQDYLGKDYAVTAFNLAAQYGNVDDKLFINDYNLEYNLDKCRGLIAYVEYIESKGARVDGIGTQMHINSSSDKEKINQMFELLAATGKLIKISELDIGVGKKTSAATDEDYQAQAEMYQYVVQKYFELIPAAQRYGITAWSPLDSPASSSWRSGEPIGLWTESYSRKPAFTGFADGFSGN